jgi:hypothetical protein
MNIMSLENKKIFMKNQIIFKFFCTTYCMWKIFELKLELEPEPKFLQARAVAEPHKNCPAPQRYLGYEYVQIREKSNKHLRTMTHF